MKKFLFVRVLNIIMTVILITAYSLTTSAVTIALKDENQVKLLCGDINQDDTLNVTDVVLSRAYIVKNAELNSISLLCADVNSDNEVNIMDVVVLRAYIVNGEPSKYISIGTSEPYSSYITSDNVSSQNSLVSQPVISSNINSFNSQNSDPISSYISSTPSTSSSEPDSSSNTPQPDVRNICGSFIQAWLVKDWTQERWDTELKWMSEAGMKYIILQSVTDFSYNTELNLGKDSSLYSLTNCYSLYPSSLPELSGANSGVDSLKECLSSCKKYNMQAIIGPVADNRWWLYGWGIPTMPDGKTDTVTDSYMSKWIAENADLNNRIASEIISLYGNDYKNQLYAWYYYNEIWNIDVACDKSDNGVYAKILSDSFNLMLEHYSDISPEMPLMISPFCNPSMNGTAEQTGEMWADIFALTDFRQGDIFAPQDSYGNNPTINLDEWFSAYKKAADKKPQLVLWANNENFRQGGTSAPLMNFLNNQVSVTEKYTEATICFSWNHYYSPITGDAQYTEDYKEYLKPDIS